MSLQTVAAAAARTGTQRLVDVIAGEWIKLRSVRPSSLTLLVTFVVTIGLSALLCAAFAGHSASLSLGDRLRFDPAFLSVSGVFLAQVSIGVLGVLTMSAEYSTGMVRTSLCAVPNRSRLFLAKLSVFLVVSLLVGFLSALVSFFVGQAIFSGHTLSLGPIGPVEQMQTTLSSAGALRAVGGAAAYLGAVGLIGLGLGALIRRTAGAIAALFALVLVLPLIVSALPSPWNTDVNEYLPSQAGSALVHVRARVDLLSPGTGLLVLGAYVVVALVAGYVALASRDA